MEKNLTAVEWLEDEIQSDMTFMEVLGLIRQAKAMEKEQSHAEYMRGWKDGLTKQHKQYESNT